jgi:hypothetical protein
MLFAGFALGSVLGKGGRISFVLRLELGLLAALNLGSALFFPELSGRQAVIAYFTLRGLAEGFYWSGRHPAMLATVGDSGRDDFVLHLQSWTVALSVVFPLISGGLVSFFALSRLRPNTLLPGGYLIVFSLTGLVLLLALAFSPRLSIPPSQLSFRRCLSLGRLKAASTWRSYLGLTGTAGMVVNVAAGVLTFGVLRAEFRIGALNASVALLSSLFFFFLRQGVRGRPGRRVQGVLAGAAADTVSRLIYALAPTGLGLGIKAVLDSFAVPLKTLFGENLLRAHFEGLSAKSGASIREIYLFQEWRLLLGRLFACAIVGGLVALVRSGPGHSDLAIRLCLAAAAPAAFAEFILLRRLSRAGGPSHEAQEG